MVLEGQCRIKREGHYQERSRGLAKFENTALKVNDKIDRVALLSTLGAPVALGFSREEKAAEKQTEGCRCYS